MGCSCSSREKVISESARPMARRKSEFPAGSSVFGFVGISRLSGGALCTIAELFSCYLVFLNAPPKLILSWTESDCNPALELQTKLRRKDLPSFN